MDRQRVLMIFGAALVCAVALTWFLWVKIKTPAAQKTVRVVAAVRDMPAGTRLRRADLKPVSMMENELPTGAVVEERLVVDHALLYPVSANEPITSAKLANLSGAEGLPATIDPGKRAISVSITDASGVAGLIQPRSKVDVLFTRTGSMTEALTTTILEDVTVLAIGRFTEVSQTQNIDPRAARPQNQVATLLVTPEESRKLELAKNQGRISLALRNPLDRSKVADNTPVTAEAIDPLVYLRAGRRNPGRAPGMNLKDPKAWAQLTAADEEPKPRKPEEKKKEPPKPRLVVDVYRGDKHVQEIFP